MKQSCTKLALMLLLYWCSVDMSVISYKLSSIKKKAKIKAKIPHASAALLATLPAAMVTMAQLID